ncbi:uncharacterized protein [Apostichopus japonicus]|uniref:uncharacterized protein n=1 Tax=Stichopus japonicus TaxID=307972 RepID=UPI003AB28240
MATGIIRLSLFLIITVVVVVYGCDNRAGHSSKKGVFQGGNHVPTLAPKKKPKRSVMEEQVISKETFILLDHNEDGFIDDLEWLRSPYGNNIRGFIKLLDELDIDGDKQISFNEFKIDNFIPDLTSKEY